MEPREMKLSRPVEFGDQVIESLTAQHVVVVDDLEDGYDELEILRASQNRPPLSKRDVSQAEMMKILLARATGQPLEMIGAMSVKDFQSAVAEFTDFLL